MDAVVSAEGTRPFRIHIFADGASLAQLREFASNPVVAGFTTNTTLMRQAGVQDYRTFARQAVSEAGGKPISLAVLADDFPGMARQAMEMAGFGENVYVKIPITNARGESSLALVRELSRSGLKVNVTALCTLGQVERSAEALRGGAAAIVSVFAGRIADTGRDPVPMMRAAAAVCAAGGPTIQLLWASPREVLNVFQAEGAGCQIITLTADLLNKLRLIGKDLEQFSLETVRMFHADAASSGYVL